MRMVVPPESGSAVLELWPIGATSFEHVVEGGTYKYRLNLPGDGLEIEPTELFEADPDDPHTGRFFPRNHVGTLRVVAESTTSAANFVVDVQPSKLDYATQYRSMMTQIADHAAEAILQGFSPVSTEVGLTADSSGELRYRALAFLVARLRDETFQAEIEQIARRPHRRWVEVREVHPLGKGLPPGSSTARSLTQGARRGPAPAHLTHLPTSLLPERIEWRRNVVTYDTPPNRFIRHAFERWRNLAADMLAMLDGNDAPGAGPRRRGIEEATWLRDRCEQMLATPVLAEAGPLRQFPHGEPTLLRQSGYRDVLRTYALADASITLDAVLPDDAFSATQRNVATLYEYWCFLTLVRCLDDVFGTQSNAALFRASENGLSLILQQGAAHRLHWDGEIRGRHLHVDLWFNRQFSSADRSDSEASSWASSMRPDVSLRIRPRSARPSDADDPHLDAWLHFDAKYRIQATDVDFSDDPVETAKRSDLLKMHSYRDAIRRSAGAFVLYPGNGAQSRRMEFQEILPGVGAFPLRPSADGVTQGVAQLEQFLRDVLDHASNQASAAERAQYWLNEHTKLPGRRVRPSETLRLPPADEKVLVGYVRSDQWAWVRRQRRYNVRADKRSGAMQLDDEGLTARLLLLWTGDPNAPAVLGLFERTGPWQVLTAADLQASDYPFREAAALYLVSEINAAGSELDRALANAAFDHLPSTTSPQSTTWDRLVSR